MFMSDMDLPLDHVFLSLALGLAIVSILLNLRHQKEIAHLHEQLHWSDQKISVLALSIAGQGSVEVVRHQIEDDGALDIEIRFRPNHTQGD